MASHKLVDVVLFCVSVLHTFILLTSATTPIKPMMAPPNLVCHPYRGALQGVSAAPVTLQSNASVCEEVWRATCLSTNDHCYGFVFTTIAASSLSTVGLPTLGGVECGPQENNTDIGDGYNLGPPTHTATVGLCCESCIATAECRSYTFVPSADSVGDGGGACWLHPIVGTKRSAPGWVSGTLAPPRPVPPGYGTCQLLSPPNPGGVGVDTGVQAAVSGLCTSVPDGDGALPMGADDLPGGQSLIRTNNHTCSGHTRTHSQ